jgi:hypothetical protein
MEEEEKDQKWQVTITRALNGYIIDGMSDVGVPYTEVIEDEEMDELKSHEKLLWFIMDYFNFQGSKHDPERIRITREGRLD